MKNKDKIKINYYGHFDRKAELAVSHYYNSGTGMHDRVALSITEGADSGLHIYLKKGEAEDLIKKIRAVLDEKALVGGDEWED